MAIKTLSQGRVFIQEETGDFSLSDVQKSEYLTFRDPNTGNIRKIVFPSNVEIGNVSNSALVSTIEIAGDVKTKGDLQVRSSGYLNFGTSGYGIRDNGGTIEFKNSGGSWTSISSGGGGGITGVTAGNGLSGGGTSGTVTVTVSAADTTISVGAGGISVDESNLSSIPNSALANNTISGVALGGNLSNLTIGNGVQLDSGTTYNGSSAVSLSIQNSDSTISVGAGGISVDESNLSGIPNSGLTNSSITIAGSAISLGGTITADTIAGQISAGQITNSQLDNSTISGKSLGADLGTVTFQSGLTATTYDGSGDVTIQNTGVVSLTGGTGINVSQSTGAVTVTATGAATQPIESRFIDAAGVNVLLGYVASATIDFDSNFVTNTNVVSGESAGVFSLASTGVYRVSCHIDVIAAANSRTNVGIRVVFTDGATVDSSIQDGPVTVSSSGAGTRLSIAAAYYTFSDASTRTIKVEILGNITGEVEHLLTVDSLGFPPAIIEITKIT